MSVIKSNKETELKQELKSKGINIAIIRET
jgi:hypothetical protein